MAQGLQLDILTPSRSVFSDTCQDVYVPTQAGEIGVLEAHENFVTLLGMGPVRIQGSKAPALCIRGGFLEIIQDNVTLLADEVCFQKEIDPAALDAQEAQIKEKLTDASLDVHTQQRLRDDLRWIETQRNLV
jgi:F-type H+-transporting ATPase subunit epsilon